MSERTLDEKIDTLSKYLLGIYNNRNEELLTEIEDGSFLAVDYVGSHVDDAFDLGFEAGKASLAEEVLGTLGV